MLENLGIFFLGLLALFPIFFILAILRAIILAWDFTCWELYLAKCAAPMYKSGLKRFCKVWFGHIGHLISYNKKYSQYSYGRSEWSGFRSWKKVK